MAAPPWLSSTASPSFRTLIPVQCSNHASTTQISRLPPASPRILRQKSPVAPAHPTPLEQTSLSYDLSCEHFQSCSGCSHELNLHRPDKMDEVYAYFKNYGISGMTGVTFHPGRLWGWRFRAKLAVSGSSRNPQIGLYRKGSHDVVDIPKCKAHHPNINVTVNLLKQAIAELDIPPYDEDSGTGKLRYVQLSVSTRNTSVAEENRYRYGMVQVTIVWNSPSNSPADVEILKELARFLWKSGGRGTDINVIHSVWANFQSSVTSIIFGSNWMHLIGPRDFWEHVGGIDILLPPSSFGHANIEVFDSLLWRIQRNVPSGASVSDLYAGGGVIGLSLAYKRKCKSVRCVERKKELKTSFEKMVQRLPKRFDSNVTWYCADVSTKPLFWLVGSDVVIVNPPKKGLDASLLDVLQNVSLVEEKLKSSKGSRLAVKDEKRPWILRARKPLAHIGNKAEIPKSVLLPRTIIYVSCGWESFKKDCDLLMASKDWELKNAHGFNFFPGTQGIEVVAIFRRSKVDVDVDEGYPVADT